MDDKIQSFTQWQQTLLAMFLQEITTTAEASEVRHRAVTTT